MQRRAAAAYAAIFLVLIGGAFVVMETAEAPKVGIENPDQTLQKGTEFTVDGRTYNTTEISATESSGGGGHGGGGGGVTYTAKLIWVNDSAQFSETWTNNSTVTYQNKTYRAFIANTSSPSEVTLRWEPSDAYSPKWVDGKQYIDSEPNTSDRQAVTVEEFVASSNNSSIQTQTLTLSNQMQFKGNQSTVNATNESVKFTWTAPKENEVTFGQNANVTLNGVKYAAHFPNGETVHLAKGEEGQKALHHAVEKEHRFHARENGLWGVIITAGVALTLLVSMAFLPRKS
ncbi:hypothetical protein [Haloarchaeobius sp. TZWWS8]|uniref:hypothetical protein n=1 Tax=Haloarchaeobius sp. TZWWS8 TaxID=3446121 RepID=UPI003EBB9129